MPVATFKPPSSRATHRCGSVPWLCGTSSTHRLVTLAFLLRLRLRPCPQAGEVGKARRSFQIKLGQLQLENCLGKSVLATWLFLSFGKHPNGNVRPLLNVTWQRRQTRSAFPPNRLTELLQEARVFEENLQN